MRHDPAPALVPDRMHGERIWRGADGLIIFQPKGMTVTHGPVLPLEELVEAAMTQLVTVSDQAGPEARAQAKLFEARLRKTVGFWMKRAVLNERERCRLALGRHGFANAQEAIFDGARER